MKVALLGGTRGLGRAVARALAERGDQVFLLGREAADLERSAKDLELRSGGAPVGFARCNLAEPEGFGPALERAETALGGLDTVVLTAGLFATQEQLEADPALCERLLDLDLTKSILFCEEVRRRLLARGGGTLCVFGSVAGERARKPVAIYGAAKAGLAHYLDGLDLRYRGAGLRVVCVLPGFIRTAMTAGLPEPPFAADPEAVVPGVLRAIDRGKHRVFVPGIWRAVMLVIRTLPRAVLRRVGF